MSEPLQDNAYMPTPDEYRNEMGLKLRPGDQQLPRTNDLPVVQDLVAEDIELRKIVGIQRYGTPLQPHNGRDVLRDAYEEALDLAMYLRQAIFERDNPLPAPETYRCGLGCSGGHPTVLEICQDDPVPPPNGWTCGPNCRSRGHDGPEDTCL